jgi:hypothetical protein
MTIQEFAYTKYHVRINDKKLCKKYRIRQHTQPVIYGRYGEIDEDKTYGEVFVARFLAVPRDANMTGALRNRYKLALAAGLKLKWKGDSESSFHFDPTNEAQARLVLRLLGVPKRRTLTLTQEQRQAMADRLARGRKARGLR